jgi:hypothetical protein
MEKGAVKEHAAARHGPRRVLGPGVAAPEPRGFSPGYPLAGVLTSRPWGARWVVGLARLDRRGLPELFQTVGGGGGEKEGPHRAGRRERATLLATVLAAPPTS